MEIKELSSVEADEFVYQNSKSHFMQTSSWKNVAQARNYDAHLLGLYKDETLKATALLLAKKIGPYKTYFCPRGPIMDYKDKELIKEVLLTLKDYVKKHDGLYLKFDPDLAIHKLSDNAEIKEIFSDNIELLNYFKELGAKHRGYTIKFKESSNPRFTFRVDVSQENLLDSFHNTTKKILKRNNPYHIDIYKGDINDVSNFYKTMSETAIRKKMYLEPLKFFNDFYTILNKDNRSDIYVAKANINSLKKEYERMFKELDEEYERIKTYSDKKQASLRIDLDDKKAKLNKELALINEIKEEEIILSSVITTKFKDKVWLIHGGNSDKLMFLNANYELYYKIMVDAQKEGYKYVDLYGSEGKIDKSSPEYGIYLFKLRFAGDFIEFMGEFDIVTRPILNTLISKALHIRRRLLIKKHNH